MRIARGAVLLGDGAPAFFGQHACMHAAAVQLQQAWARYIGLCST